VGGVVVALRFDSASNFGAQQASEERDAQIHGLGNLTLLANSLKLHGSGRSVALRARQRPQWNSSPWSFSVLAVRTAWVRVVAATSELLAAGVLVTDRSGHVVNGRSTDGTSEGSE